MSRHHTNYARMAGPGDWWTPPDDDGLTECPVCSGAGSRIVADDGWKPYREVCPCCEGHKFLDENGMPYVKEPA